jgi:hypothetical protein
MHVLAPLRCNLQQIKHKADCESSFPFPSAVPRPRPRPRPRPIDSYNRAKRARRRPLSHSWISDNDSDLRHLAMGATDEENWAPSNRLSARAQLGKYLKILWHCYSAGSNICICLALHSGRWGELVGCSQSL